MHDPKVNEYIEELLATIWTKKRWIEIVEAKVLELEERVRVDYKHHLTQSKYILDLENETAAQYAIIAVKDKALQLARQHINHETLPEQCVIDEIKKALAAGKGTTVPTRYKYEGKGEPAKMELEDDDDNFTHSN